jgi:superfamily II DNA or RNA helicase
MRDSQNEEPHLAPSVPPAPVCLSGQVSLVEWQEKAVRQWIAGDDQGHFRGTLEIFTGGGKTLIALAAFARVSALDPNTRLAIVVPSEALARQWVTTLLRETTLTKTEIGMLGAGSKDNFEGKRALVSVLNSAARKLPDLASAVSPLMLVVDECHRAGAATFSKVLTTKAKYRLGLSATPSRDEIDETGLPLNYDRQVVGRKIGSVVFQFGLREAREIGWLPVYTVHHHGVRLHEEERREYERISRKVTDAADRLTSGGFQTSRAWSLVGRGGEAGSLAQSYIGALTARKDFLYRASERGRVAARLVTQCLGRENTPRILLFHERVAEVESLFTELRSGMPDARIGIEHSELPAAARRKALAKFRSGELDVLISVKSLVEGIDVPDADVGISVASSSSVRQRIQTLGRVLRRRFDGGIKQAEMHVIYVHDTVDQSIYGKEDWSDLTGADANRYWLWPLDPDIPPEAQAEPPLRPRPTEEAEWKRLGETVPSEPTLWLGELPDYEFSVDTRGNVSTSEGAWIDNPQGVSVMVERIRGRPGGRFRVTPLYNLVIVYGESGQGVAPFLAGKISEPLRLREEATDDTMVVDAASLTAGASYPGPQDKVNGTFKFRQKKGGVIERRQGNVFQFASTQAEQSRLAVNARQCLSAWKSLGAGGFTFYVNRLEHAWYRAAGEARFLAVVPGGFLWPDSAEPTPATDDPTLTSEGNS